MATKKQDGGIVETIKTIVWALIIAGVFRTLFFQPFWIPSGSMKDTLLVGDFLFASRAWRDHQLFMALALGLWQQGDKRLF